MRGGARPVRGRRTTDWTRALTDAERKAWADGAEEHSTQGFAGHDNLDRMGLVDMGERLYDPQLDQFLSPDPVSQPYSPQGWNPYSYLGNRPLSRVDPDGRLAAVGGAHFVEAPDGEQAFARRGRQFGVTLKLRYDLVRMDSMFMVRVPSVGLRSPKATRMGAGGGSFRHRRRAQPVMAAAVPNLSEPAQPCWSTTKKRDGGTDMRRCLRMCVLAGAASVAGCHLLPSRINDLAASVEGPVGEADLRPIAGDSYSSFAWGRYASARRQLLRARLSTTKDMVQFASRKNARIIVKWRFCGEPNRRVLLGGWDAYVGGVRVPAHDGPTPTVTDERGRFAYDAVLYARDPRSAEDRWFPALGQYEEAYDLEREPRDVCVRVVFARMLSAYRTTVATIPKEAIAAALGVPADGTNAPVSEQSAGEAPILCVGAYEQAAAR